MFEHDRLVAPSLPVASSGDEAVAAAPPRVASYLLRWLVFGSGLAPQPVRNRWSARRAAQEETRRLGRALVERLATTLGPYENDAFVILFQGASCLGPEGGHGGWRERLLTEELARHGIHWVLPRRELREHARLHDLPPGAYFIEGGRERGHLTALGNEVAFGSILRGLEGQFDGPEGL